MAILIPIQCALVLPAPLVLPSSLALAQDSPSPPEKKRSDKGRPITYGVEIELSSGHADRGLVISDRPVVQPVTWVSAGVATFSQPHFYIRQYFQFSTIVNRAVRAELARPTLFFVGLATGVEF